jgi:hypothetical protein
MSDARPLSEAEVLEIARRYADERGWTWREPVNVRPVRHEGAAAFRVDTHVGFRGVNARIVVRAADGSVLDAGYLPR